MSRLAGRTVAGFVQLMVVLAVVLFAPAWTLAYWQAWLYLVLFSAWCALITVYLWTKDPVLLERRVKAGPGAEKEPRQNLIQAFASLSFAGIFIVSSLDRRFWWSHVPLEVVIAGNVLVALGFYVVFVVFRENAFAGATIEVLPGQRVVSTGPYAIVRHPMYAGALVMLSGTPLALGSWWGLVALVPMTFVIVWRLRAEEQALARNLEGYAQYREIVRYRLLPSIW